ncbi:MAG: hypothetical protein ACERKN_08400 [Velocimicrobium sp.]
MIGNKGLLNVKEFCFYLGIGQSKARELLNEPHNGFTVRIGTVIDCMQIRKI